MIYLDSAATTLQKPPAVSRAASFATTHMASPGRGGHQPAMRAADTVFACRNAAAELFHVEDPGRVVFTMNATHGLNLAIKTLVKPGDTVLVSGYEHNAVTRPLYAQGADVRVVEGALFRPREILARFEEMMTPEVRCVVCNHVSNVFGFTLPVEKIAALCRRRGIAFVLDASQSAGNLPVFMDQLKAAFIAMPGHKGLLGPQGTGLLLCGEEVETKTLLEGGTGSLSARQEMPEFLPDRLEAGTLNVCGIAGLLEGIRYVRKKGTDRILNHEKSLTAQMAEGLMGMGHVRAYVDQKGDSQTGVLSFNIIGTDCEMAAQALGARGICVRAGLHCAPLAHKSAGTFETGTVRASVSPFNTPREIQLFLREIARMANT